MYVRNYYSLSSFKVGLQRRAEAFFLKTWWVPN